MVRETDAMQVSEKFGRNHITATLNKKIKLNSNFITLDLINKVLSTLAFISILAVNGSAKYFSYFRRSAGVKSRAVRVLGTSEPGHTRSE